MCGLVAVYSPGRPLPPGVLARPLDALRHRGPDASGAWTSADGTVALGHTRLAIIDLDGGGQPIAGSDPRSQIVVTGEFYGYEPIRDELRASGRRLRTASDSEIALHLHELHGDDAALARLRGEFAYVLWDGVSGRLLAVRDRFGVKPLFYAWHGGRLHLASEVKALLACGVPARWDLDALADHLQVALPATGTLFAGVRQVPPGGYLLAAGGAVETGSWWDLDFPVAGEAEQGGGGPDRDELLGALRDAVTVRLRADVDVACHLSGGLDSSSVLALAAEGGDVTAFTVRFDDPAFDEGAVARRTASALGVAHREIACDRSRYASLLAPTLRAGEMIQENAHGIARYLQSAAIREQGFKVVLAGEGGDELFAAYPQLRRDLELTLSPAARARAAQGYAKLAALGLPPHLRSLLEQIGFVPSWVLERYMNVTLPLRSLLSPGFADLLDRRDGAAAPLRASEAQRAGRSAFHQSLYLFYRTWFCNYILATERLDMAHGVEVRLPLLDHKLFELVRRAPLRWYEAGGVAKQPLLSALGSRLPVEVARAPKRPFFAPPVAGDSSALAELRRLARSEALGATGIFDMDRVRALLERTATQDGARLAGNERVLHVVASVAVLTETFDLARAA